MREETLREPVELPDEIIWQARKRIERLMNSMPKSGAYRLLKIAITALLEAEEQLDLESVKARKQ